MPKGVYPRTDEMRAHMSTAKRGCPAPGTPFRPGQAAFAGRTYSIESREKMRAAKLGKPGPWAGKKRGPYPVEWRRKISVGNRGREASVAHRSSYNGTLFRSSWEVRAAKAFDALGVRWEYEPHRIDLGSQTYRPDFFLPDDGAYWEVKGYFGPKSQRTTALFRKLRPEPLVLVTATALALLERAALNVAA